MVFHTLHVRSYEPVMNLSPLLLKAQLVSGNIWARRILNKKKSLLEMSSPSLLLFGDIFSSSLWMSWISCDLLLLLRSPSFEMILSARELTSVDRSRSNKSITFVFLDLSLSSYSRMIPLLNAMVMWRYRMKRYFVIKWVSSIKSAFTKHLIACTLCGEIRN